MKNTYSHLTKNFDVYKTQFYLKILSISTYLKQLTHQKVPWQSLYVVSW